MGNVKTGLKQRLEYVFPKEYNFYKKNLDVEDDKIVLKSNYCIDCVKEEDIWFKLYFMYGAQDGNNMNMHNLNGVSGNNKSDFKYILAGSGLRKIFDYHIDWSRAESMDIFEFTYLVATNPPNESPPITQLSISLYFFITSSALFFPKSG